MRIVVCGAGAVGGYFGGQLARAGLEVGWFARGATLGALREKGFRVESLQGDFTLPPQRASDRPEELGSADAVVLGTYYAAQALIAFSVGVLGYYVH